MEDTNYTPKKAPGSYYRDFSADYAPEGEEIFKAVHELYKRNKCPNCGAPADKMGQSGVCEYCGSKITDGNFSWVLFSITQDEVYEG